MDILLSVDKDESSQDLERLERWLRDEPDLRGRIARVPTAPKPGEMGTLAGALSVALGSGGAVSVLIASLKTFFRQPRGSDLKISIRTPDGAVIEVDAKRVRNVESTIREALGLEP